MQKWRRTDVDTATLVIFSCHLSLVFATMPPSDFQKARDAAAAAAAAAGASSSSPYLYAEIDGRPYFPSLHAKPSGDDDNTLSILRAAIAVVLATANGDGDDAASSSSSSALSTVSMPSDEELAGHLTVKVVSGGITNSLYRVSGLTTSTLLADALPETSELKGHDSVLVRVFGKFMHVICMYVFHINIRIQYACNQLVPSSFLMSLLLTAPNCNARLIWHWH